MNKLSKAEAQVSIREARKALSLLAFAVSHEDDEKAAERIDVLESHVGRVRNVLRLEPKAAPAQKAKPAAKSATKPKGQAKPRSRKPAPRPEPVAPAAPDQPESLEADHGGDA